MDREPDTAALTTPTELDLAGNLDISSAPEQRERLIAALAATQGLSISLAGVERVDTAGLQLLLACEKSAKTRGIALTWVAPSEAVRRAANGLGVAGMLRLDDTAGDR